MSKVRTILIVFVLGGCDRVKPSVDAAQLADSPIVYPPDASPPDAPPPDARPDAPATCQQLSEAAEAVIAGLVSSCSTVDDCLLVGGTYTCNCAPSLTRNASGDAVSRAALDGSAELQSLIRDFDQRCLLTGCGDGKHCICDAAPARLLCRDGRCVAEPRSCLDLIPDAPR